MKKILAVLLIAALMLTICACGNGVEREKTPLERAQEDYNAACDALDRQNQALEDAQDRYNDTMDLLDKLDKIYGND